MKNNILKLLVCSAFCVSVIGCFPAYGTSSTTSNASRSSASSKASVSTDSSAAETDVDANALANTAWTTDIGEEYGAAVQGDEEETLTTLSLYFTEDGHAYNVVGDISFDYKLNADGTINVSNLNLGDTTINSDVFELTYTNGTLTLHTRINGGNADLSFTQERTTDEGDITDSDFSKYVGTYTSENKDTLTIGEDGSVDISIVRLCSMQGTAEEVYKGIMPIIVTDPADNEMALEFNTETKELIVIDSTWDNLKNGETFEMDK